MKYLMGDFLRIKTRGVLRKSDKNKLIRELEAIFGSSISTYSNSKFETVVTDNFNLIYVDGKQMFMEYENTYFPTVRGALLLNPDCRTVTVDSGAVKFVINGADIMCPGIVKADDDIKPGDLVIITEEQHDKPLAIGKAILSGSELAKHDKGKGVLSISYVGDPIWDLSL